MLLNAVTRVSLTLLLLASLSACSSWYARDKNDQAKNDCPRKNTEGVCFPDPKASWLGTIDGTYINPQSVSAIRSGMTKDEVRETISYPHFKEGFFEVREWDYVFKFRTAPTGSDFVMCQYKVAFDEHARVKSAHWYESRCNDFLRTPVIREVVVSTPPPQRKQVTETIIIGTDALFAFDKSDLKDLLPGGKEKLDDLLKVLRENYSEVEWLFVTGHTDPLGGDTYNQKLSEARANTVRNHLVKNGFPVNAILVKGLAAQQTAKQCPTNLSIPDLIECHQENRRVTVEVRGYRK